MPKHFPEKSLPSGLARTGTAIFRQKTRQNKRCTALSDYSPSGNERQAKLRSISRKSGHLFSAGNATKYKHLERFPIQGNREAL
jgi:hypothetical protein